MSQSSSATRNLKADIDCIIKYAPAELIGREAETKLLANAWGQAARGEKKRPHILTFVALGGEGKTSLVAKWAADLAHQGWPGCDAVFAWSFYSQGTREQHAASSDLFLSEALSFFGDAAMAGSAAGAFDKGRRLAQLVGERRALLILDGLEPLQYAPISPTPGELKDHGLATLLKGLAANSQGLCVVTTRYAIPDLRAFIGKTVREENLLRLSTEAGVALLQSLGVKGSLRRTVPSDDGRELWNEYEKLVEDVKGHALTLNLLGSYLRDAHAGDIRKQDLIRLEEADAEEQGGHAFRVMDAYVQSLESGGKTAEEQAKGRRALALLQLFGLFDRPATADCLNALWQPPAIAGLTEALFTTEKKWLGLSQTFQPISEAQRNLSLKRLEDARLLTVNRDAAGKLLSLDAHPLLREYFSRRVRQQQQQPEAWREAHRRLYEHLCATTKEGEQPTLKDLQPLYQAIAHGCNAGLYRSAVSDIYWTRILHGFAHYSWRELGALAEDLSALACFYEFAWRQVNATLSHEVTGLILHQSALCLRGLGRLAEAIEPVEVALKHDVERRAWNDAAMSANLLSEVNLLLGRLDEALRVAQRSVEFADCSSYRFYSLANRTTVGEALHQMGRHDEAFDLFQEAEAIHAEEMPELPILPSLGGLRYCDLLLNEVERSAWNLLMLRTRWGHRLPHSYRKPTEGKIDRYSPTGAYVEMYVKMCRSVEKCETATLEWNMEGPNDILSAAFQQLSLGRASLLRLIIDESVFRSPEIVLDSPYQWLTLAMDRLRHASLREYVVYALLALAWLRSLKNDANGARADLDEAWEIAERGMMKLYMADIHLYRARLFFREKSYPWKSPQDDLAAAEKLINDCGYHRRDIELADAKQTILG